MKILLLGWLAMVMALAFLHGDIMNVTKNLKWWIIHFLRAPFFWPLYLVEIVFKKFWKRGAIALGIWLVFCWFSAETIAPIVSLKATRVVETSQLGFKILLFFPVITFFVTFCWWCIAAIFAALGQELKKSYPFADPF